MPNQYIVSLPVTVTFKLEGVHELHAVNRLRKAFRENELEVYFSGPYRPGEIEAWLDKDMEFNAHNQDLDAYIVEATFPTEETIGMIAEAIRDQIPQQYRKYLKVVRSSE